MLSTRPACGIVSGGRINLVWTTVSVLAHLTLILLFRPSALQSPSPGYTPVDDYAHLFTSTIDLGIAAIVIGFVVTVVAGRIYYGVRD